MPPETDAHPGTSSRRSGRVRAIARRAPLALSALAFVLGCAEERGSRPNPRNLMIIALDTLRADRLGFYGHPRPTSPSLDRLARESFVFENAQAQSSWTAPSLITLMTGLNTDVHQVSDSPNPGRMSENVTTLAELLRRAGFETAAFTEGGYAKGQFGLDQGFDLYPPSEGESTTDHAIDPHESRLAANVDRTLAWLRGRRRDRPFFLFFHTYEAHAPYRASEEAIRAFRPGFDEDVERAELERIISTWNRDRTITKQDCEFLTPRSLLFRTRASWAGLPAIEAVEELARVADGHGVGPGNLLARPELRELVGDLYDAGVASVDRGVERLLAGLRELGLDQETLVVVVSDHGEGLGEHGQLEHGYELHEEVLRVVLTMRVPRTTATPRRIADVVQLVDVAPTLLELLDVEARGNVFQGRSLVPALHGGRHGFPAFSHGRTIDRSTDSLYSVRTEQWRLNLDLSTQQVALYDRALDPREETDVAASHPEVVSRLRSMLLRQHEQDLVLQRALASDVEFEALDAKTLEELRGLGYAGADADGR